VEAEVTGSAIVSIAPSLDGQETLSRVTPAIAALIWVTVVTLLPLRAAHDRGKFRDDARTPAALTAAVATAVLATRPHVARIDVSWKRGGDDRHRGAHGSAQAGAGGWNSPAVGVSLLLAVAPESIAALAATLATSEHPRSLLIAAHLPCLPLH
jgi:hypothetical protein